MARVAGQVRGRYCSEFLLCNFIERRDIVGLAVVYREADPWGRCQRWLVRLEVDSKGGWLG